VSIFEVVLIVPALVVLALAVTGVWLLLRPSRGATGLADGGLPSHLAFRGFAKHPIMMRLGGVALIVGGIFLGVTVMHLWEGINHWQPAPQSPFVTSCAANRPHGMPCIPTH
jgi:hypothetical protein